MPIPFLGGSAQMTVSEPKSHHGRVSTFNHLNGYSIPKPTTEQLAVKDYTDEEIAELTQSALRLTYGEKLGHTTPAPAVVPSYVHLDKKVLFFEAYMKQTVHESAQEQYRVRFFRVFYYLEDDTISINEPEIENSGMVHGTYLSRQQLPKPDGIDPSETYHWTALNIGKNVSVYGRVLRIYNVSDSTRKFLESEGMVVPAAEDQPADPYIKSRAVTDNPKTLHQTKNDFDELRQFLVLDRKVLRFHCTWDDPSIAGARLKATVHYYLVDDTVEVREVHTANNGRDPFPILQRRQRVPRNHRDTPRDFAATVFEISPAEVKEYVSPADFAIGKEVSIYGRLFLVYDMDEFTREFYRQNFGVTEFNPIDVAQCPQRRPQPEIPPYTGIGSPEDSYLSCVSINPTAPAGQKSLLQLLKYDNAILRYESYLDPTRHPDDDGRKFILSIRLADNFVSIFEPPIQNSGIQGGTILSFQRVQQAQCNPDQPEYLAPRDFFVGGSIEIHKRLYHITGCDRFVLTHMEAHPGDYDAAVVEATRVLFAN